MASRLPNLPSLTAWLPSAAHKPDVTALPEATDTLRAADTALDTAPDFKVPSYARAICRGNDARLESVAVWLNRTIAASEAAKAGLLSNGHVRDSQTNAASLVAAAGGMAALFSTASARTKKGMSNRRAAWWNQMLKALEPKERLSLFRTSRMFRDLLLVMWNDMTRLRIQLPIVAERSGVTHSLLLACKLSHNVQLVLAGDTNYTCVASSSAACDLLSFVMGVMGNGTTAIKSVHLQGLSLNNLVPMWLTFTCPNMTSLQLLSCSPSPNLPGPSAILPTCGQLKHLHLFNPPHSRDHPMQLRWQHQLRSLTSLESLSLESYFTGDDLALTKWIGTCSAAVGAQLTQLSVRSGNTNATLLSVLGPMADREAFSAALFPGVRDLSLNMTVTDGGMEVLLGMPSLRRLQCRGFQLRLSYTGRACGWTQLAFRELDVASAARLPLAAVQSLQLAAADQVCTIIPSCDQEVTRQAVAAVSGCASVQWGGTVRIAAQLFYGSVSCASIAAILPLLSTCQATSLVISGAAVTAELLAAIKQHLFTTRLTRFKVQGGSVAADVWPLVLPSLPPSVQELCVEDHVMQEDHVIALCVPACRPVRVQVDSVTWGSEAGAGPCDGWEEGWEQRVQAAMVAAGHQHVQLSIDL